MRKGINLAAGIVLHPGEAEGGVIESGSVLKLNQVLVRVFGTDSHPETLLSLDLKALRTEGLPRHLLPRQGQDVSIDIDLAGLSVPEIEAHVTFLAESQWTAQLDLPTAISVKNLAVRYDDVLPDADYIRQIWPESLGTRSQENKGSAS